MIGQQITDESGAPLEHYKKLTPSLYQPSDEVKDLFKKVQHDYSIAWNLQRRGFDEFDGYSLLDRARLDQGVFAAYVGIQYLPVHKKWRWRGRKNTARNKLMGILAHMIAGMLFPYVYAQNEHDEEDKMTAQVMRILVEDHLKRAGYETKFLYIVLSALVNPAVFVQIQYVEAIQRVKQRLADGKIKIVEAVDEFLSGLNINILPIDEVLLADFYTADIQRQPYVARLRRISYDTARGIYGENKNFKYVEAGKTKVWMTSENNQLFDVEWTEADADFVQELTLYYRQEDLEVTFVGGVFMGNEEDVYNSNPFKHRRLSLIGEEWISVPVYDIAKSGFEPIDPTGRFAYYKSGAFKEYWDSLGSDRMYQLAHDGTYLDVIKPLFMSGVANTNSVVMAPGVTVGMPMGADVKPYQLGPNLQAALQMMDVNKGDMSESTQDKVMSGLTEKGVTATQSNIAAQNARVMLGNFGVMMADLVKQIGELAMDCEIQHTTVGEIDASVPEALSMKFKAILAKGQEKGRRVTNKIIFTDEFMGQPMTDEEKNEKEWELYDKAGGEGSDQRIYKVNPYLFARHKFSMYVDADKITMKSMGADKERKVLAFNMMTDPRVAPYTDQKAVVEDFVIEEFSDGDPDRYKKKTGENDMLNSIMQIPETQVPQTQL
ncbi:MAG TPA: hypothetical protein V6D19_13005 [Stenomitos sp.]